MFIKLLAVGCLCWLSACVETTEETTTASSTSTTGGGGGGMGGSATNGGGGSMSSSDGGGGAATSSSSTSTSTADQCAQEACAEFECGFTQADCDGDGVKDHIDCGGCAPPAACLGSNELHKCGTKCLALPEYTGACGAGVEFACDNSGCGFCYKYGPDGKPIYKVVGVDCPTATAPDGTEVRCCVSGCGGDC